MNYGSVCSGIEAASCAWHPLGWRAQFLSEIEAFPSAVLAHHYPTTPNLGDMTNFKDWPDATLDLLVGGTPCQSFSVAGLRKGLADPRGNLMLTYLAIAARFSPRWLVWENVPGVLSSNGGRDFGALLGGLAELGYGFAYRILDAQFFGVPQRRRRVFVVGYLGDWRRAAAVLFERESLLGHPAPRREPREGVAPTLSARTKGGGGLGTDFDLDGGLIPQVARALTTSNQRIDAETETLLVAHSLRGEGFDASEDGTGRGTPLVPVYQGDSNGKLDDRTLARAQDLPGGTVREVRCSESGSASQGRQLAQQRAGELGTPLPELSHQRASSEGEMHCMRSAREGSGVLQQALPPVQAMGRPLADQGQPEHTGFAVRRLTPRECERLQGFPDDYTQITHRSKAATDSPRYKALGNSMAVPVMRWIGERIQTVEALA